jgi:hypothetical protein
MLSFSSLACLVICCCSMQNGGGKWSITHECTRTAKSRKVIPSVSWKATASERASLLAAVAAFRLLLQRTSRRHQGVQACNVDCCFFASIGFCSIAMNRTYATLRYSTLLYSTRRLFSSSILFQVILPTRELFQFLLAFIYFLFRQDWVDDDVYRFCLFSFSLRGPLSWRSFLSRKQQPFPFCIILSTVLFIKRWSKHSRIYARDNPGYEWCFFLQLRLQRRSFPRRPDSLFSIYVGWFDWVGLALFSLSLSSAPFFFVSEHDLISFWLDRRLLSFFSLLLLQSSLVESRRPYEYYFCFQSSRGFLDGWIDYLFQVCFFSQVARLIALNRVEKLACQLG